MRATGLFAAFAIIFAAPLAHATPDAPRVNAEYSMLKAAQPVQASGKKIEVIEFFMYHCPACNALEPELVEWIKQHADTVAFRRVHLPHVEGDDPEAHLFLALDAMKLEDELHAKVMRTWHVDHQRLKSESDNVEWAVKNGVDKEKFLAMYNSFSVQTKVRGLARYTGNYGVNGTPTLVVDGRYMTSPSMVYEANKYLTNTTVGKATMQVLDALVATAAKAPR